MTLRILMTEPMQPLGKPIRREQPAPAPAPQTWTKADTPGYSRSSDGQMRRDDAPKAFVPVRRDHKDVSRRLLDFADLLPVPVIGRLIPKPVAFGVDLASGADAKAVAVQQSVDHLQAVMEEATAARATLCGISFDYEARIAKAYEASGRRDTTYTRALAQGVRFLPWRG